MFCSSSQRSLNKALVESYCPELNKNDGKTDFLKFCNPVKVEYEALRSPCSSANYPTPTDRLLDEQKRWKSKAGKHTDTHTYTLIDIHIGVFFFEKAPESVALCRLETSKRFGNSKMHQRVSCGKKSEEQPHGKLESCRDVCVWGVECSLRYQCVSLQHLCVYLSRITSYGLCFLDHTTCASTVDHCICVCLCSSPCSDYRIENLINKRKVR